MKDRILKSIPVINNEKVNTLEVKLYYSKGGINYFTGRDERRGLYLSVCPYFIKNFGDGMGSRSYTAFTGVKDCVKETKRFNQKELDTFVVDEEKINFMIKHVIEKNNLEIEEEPSFMCSNCGGGFKREEMVFDENNDNDFCNTCSN